MQRRNVSSRYRPWLRFMPRRPQRETARSRAKIVTAKPMATSKIRKMVQKTIPRPQAPLQGRVGHNDAKSLVCGFDIRARLRARCRALDYCGVVGLGDDLRGLSVQFG